MKSKCSTKHRVAEADVSGLHDFFKAVADKNRLKILSILQTEPRCVCEIFPEVGISQKLASHHLGRLKKIKLIIEHREGNFIRYSINEQTFKKYKTLFNELLTY